MRIKIQKLVMLFHWKIKVKISLYIAKWWCGNDSSTRWLDLHTKKFHKQGG